MKHQPKRNSSPYSSTEDGSKSLEEQESARKMSNRQRTTPLSLQGKLNDKGAAQQQQEPDHHQPRHKCRREVHTNHDMKLLVRTILRYSVSCIVQYRSIVEDTADFHTHTFCGIRLPLLDAVDDFGNIASAQGALLNMSFAVPVVI